jgi:hypothetical protein
MATAQVEITNVTSFDFYVLKTKEQKELKELIDRLVAKYRRRKPFTEPKEAEPRFGEYYLLCSKENGGVVSDNEHYWSWKRVKLLTEPDHNEEIVLRVKERVFLIDEGVTLTRNFSHLHVRIYF